MSVFHLQEKALPLRLPYNRTTSSVNLVAGFFFFFLRGLISCTVGEQRYYAVGQLFVCDRTSIINQLDGDKAIQARLIRK